MLELYLALFLPAPLSARWISTFILAPVLSVARISNRTERFNKLSTNTWVRMSSTYSAFYQRKAS